VTALSWRAAGRIAVSGPATWAPVERVVVHHGDGAAMVTVETWPVGEDADLEQLATAHAERTRGRSAASQEEPWHEATVLGAPHGRARTVRGEDADGRPTDLVQSYALRSGRAVAVTTMVPQGDAALAEEAAQIAGSAVLVRTTEVDQEVLPLRPADGVDLSATGATWLAGRSPGPATTHVLTTEECFAVAEHHGVTMLPGADTSEWMALSADERLLVRGTAWRSLKARGAESDPGLREVLSLAASHDVLMVVTAHESASPDSRPRTTWYAARPDRMVRVQRGDEPGQVLLTAYDTACLADLVVGESRAEDTLTASVVHREAGRVVGRETTWSGAGPADEAREHLAGLLPGGAMSVPA
jgi:hypothetical protein